MIEHYICYPDDEQNDESLRLNAPEWMLDTLKLNPDYVGSWDVTKRYSPDEILKALHSDELNEIAAFYFEISRKAEYCPDCEGDGYNPSTHELNTAFNEQFRFSHGTSWSNVLPANEIELLKVNGRFGMPLDAITRDILVKYRAEQAGVYGLCNTCEGWGDLFIDDAPRLNLHVWMIQPRTGRTHGVCLQDLRQEHLLEVYALLHQAANRNARNFSKITSVIS